MTNKRVASNASDINLDALVNAVKKYKLPTKEEKHRVSTSSLSLWPCLEDLYGTSVGPMWHRLVNIKRELTAVPTKVMLVSVYNGTNFPYINTIKDFNDFECDHDVTLLLTKSYVPNGIPMRYIGAIEGKSYNGIMYIMVEDKDNPSSDGSVSYMIDFKPIVLINDVVDDFQTKIVCQPNSIILSSHCDEEGMIGVIVMSPVSDHHCDDTWDDHYVIVSWMNGVVTINRHHPIRFLGSHAKKNKIAQVFLVQ